jgi:ribosomal protein S12 methylthiotransferase accessory factor
MMSPSRSTRSPRFNPVLNEAIPDALRASLPDKNRLSPMLAGASCIDGHVLTVRTPTQDVQVRANKRLLSKVFALCDGTRTFQEILSALPPRFDRDEFGQFMEFLLEEQALIDGALVTASAARYAFQDSPFGMAAEAALTDQIRRRFLWNEEGACPALPENTRKIANPPLNELFSARMSSRTFDEIPVSETSLLALLWSIAGVVSIRHERTGYDSPKRTIASGGALQLIKVFVVLQRSTGSYQPGVYRVHYPHERAVALEHLGDGHELIPRAFIKPWELTYATGAIFLAADVRVASTRYRNRALQYLFMEAGAALHNGGLSAPQLGLGFATIGGYYEKTASRMCRLTEELILGAAIFGPEPTPDQIHLIHRAPDLDFAWVDGDSGSYVMPFHLARAKVKAPDGRRSDNWGRDANPWLAYRKAAAEAIEREGLREPRNLQFAKFRDLPNGIDPLLFAKYSDAQYASSGFPYSRFNPEISQPWAAAVDLVSGNEVRVLAELVFSRTSLAAFGRLPPRPFSQVTTSGCAAGVSQEDASFRALLELVERDAFVKHWLLQTGADVIAPSRLAPEIVDRIQKIEALGCKVVVQKLSSPWAHVCMLAAQHEARHFTTMGTSANANFEDAARDALSEIETRVYAWLHGHQPQVSEPDKVNSPMHHFDLYGAKRYFRRADRVLFPGSPPSSVNLAPFPFHNSAQLVDSFEEKGIHPIMIDMTPERCYLDQGRTKISVVKTMIPGLLPISFGYHIEPMGMLAQVHRGSKFPHPFP